LKHRRPNPSSEIFHGSISTPHAHHRGNRHRSSPKSSTVDCAVAGEDAYNNAVAPLQPLQQSFAAPTLDDCSICGNRLQLRRWGFVASRAIDCIFTDLPWYRRPPHVASAGNARSTAAIPWKHLPLVFAARC
jgi:hypothetical protein